MTTEELKKVSNVLEAAGFTVVTYDLGTLLAQYEAEERRHRALEAHHRPLNN
jgi:hypothetical protein